jgi:hypothetical protein
MEEEEEILYKISHLIFIYFVINMWSHAAINPTQLSANSTYNMHYHNSRETEIHRLYFSVRDILRLVVNSVTNVIEQTKVDVCPYRFRPLSAYLRGTTI